MKIRCIRKYYDRMLKKTVTPSDKAYEVTDERAKFLITRKVAEEANALRNSSASWRTCQYKS